MTNKHWPIAAVIFLVGGCVAGRKPVDYLAMSQKPPLVFRQTLFIAAPAARVWQAIITPGEVAHYHLCPLELIELHPGGRIIYGTARRPFITGTVVEVQPDRKLVHTFRFDSDTHDNVAKDAVSRVTYEIVPMGDMCQLTLTHDEFGADNQTYANINGGWPTILSGLKTWVETGKVLPWPTGDKG